MMPETGMEPSCVRIGQKLISVDRIPFTSNGRLASSSVTGGPGEPVDFAVNPKGGEDRYP